MLTKDGIIILKGMVEATTAEWGAGKGHRDCLIIAYDSHLECLAENERLREIVKRCAEYFKINDHELPYATRGHCIQCNLRLDLIELADGKKEEDGKDCRD